MHAQSLLKFAVEFLWCSWYSMFVFAKVSVQVWWIVLCFNYFSCKKFPNYWLCQPSSVSMTNDSFFSILSDTELDMCLLFIFLILNWIEVKQFKHCKWEMKVNWQKMYDLKVFWRFVAHLICQKVILDCSICRGTNNISVVF